MCPHKTERPAWWQGALVVEWSLRRRKLTVCVTSWLSKTRAIFRRKNKRPHHLRLEGIATVEVQLPKPEDEARRVRITSQVPDVFHVDKHPTVFLIVEGLAVSGRKLHIAFTDYECSVHYLPQHTGSRLCIIT